MEMEIICLKFREVMISCKKFQSSIYITIHKPLVTDKNIETKKYWGLGDGKRTSERKKGEEDAEFGSSSRVHML